MATPTPPAAPGVETAGVRRRPKRTALALSRAALLAVGAGAAVLLWRSRTASTALDADLLAVAPFDVLDPGLQLWREGLVDLLSRNLDGAGPLRTVPPTAVVRRWSGRADRLSAADLGRRTGARLAVYGSLVPAGGDSARLRATLYDVEENRALAELELGDAVRRIDRLADSLTVRILGELGRQRRIELTRVASLGSTSPAALKAFLQGEQWFRRAGWDSATAAYKRAVALDSSFALALWRLSRVIGWQSNGDDSLEIALAVRAGELNRRLAPRDSLLVAVDSMVSAGTADTWAGYRRLRETAQEAVRRYPDDVDAWYTLGEIDRHVGWARGVSPRQAITRFERAIGLDSTFAPAYIHAFELAPRVYGFDAGRRYAAAFLERAQGGVTVEGTRLALDLSDPRRARSPAVQQALKRAPGNVLVKAYFAFRMAVDSGEVAVEIGRALLASHDTTAEWYPEPVRRASLVGTLTYRGHLDEAAHTWSAKITTSAEELAELGLFHEVLPSGAEALLAGSLRDGPLKVALDMLPVWSARGDTATVVRVAQRADSVARSGADPATQERGVYGGAAARAYLALARRDTADALRKFETLPDSLCGGCYLDALTRLLLLAAGREDRKVLEASGWEGDSPAGGEVMARLARARSAERLGERGRATREYQFVVDAWRHADPELQAYVAEARGALERLTGKPR
jgi:serine/threonine-protein kinase